MIPDLNQREIRIKSRSSSTRAVNPIYLSRRNRLLDEGSMLLLKNHYAACYWLLRKSFLDYLEDSISQDSLIGSTIST